MKYKKRIKAFVMFALKGKKKAAGIDTGIIYGTSTPITISFHAMSAAFKKKIKMIFEISNYLPKNTTILMISKKRIIKIIK